MTSNTVSIASSLCKKYIFNPPWIASYKHTHPQQGGVEVASEDENQVPEFGLISVKYVSPLWHHIGTHFKSLSLFLIHTHTQQKEELDFSHFLGSYRHGNKRHNINNLLVHLKSSIFHNLNQADWSISPVLRLSVLAHFHFSNTNHLWEVLLRKANHTSHTSVFPPASMISKGKQPTVAYSYMCIIIKAHVSFIYFSKQLWHIGSPLKRASRKHWFGGRVEVIQTCSWGKVPVSQYRQLVQPPVELQCDNKP